MNKTEINRLALIFLLITTFNLAGWALLLDFGSIPYSESLFAWSDLIYYQKISEQLSYNDLRFFVGVNLYPSIAYSFFGDCFFCTVLANSIFFSFSVFLLSKISKKNLWLFVIATLPVTFYFSGGFNKEAPLILLTAVVVLAWSRACHSWLANFLLILVKPMYGVIVMVLSLKFLRKRVFLLIILLLLFSPFLKSFFVFLHSGSFYFYRIDSLENSVRLNFFFISIFGYFLFVIKLFFEPFISFFETPNANTFFVAYFATLVVFIFFRRFRFALNYIGLLLLFVSLCLSFHIIVHFRYYIPILFVWSYILLSMNFKRFSQRPFVSSG